MFGGGLCPRLSGGSLSSGVSVQGCLCQGDPPAVRLLTGGTHPTMECILVLNNVLEKLFCKHYFSFQERQRQTNLFERESSTPKTMMKPKSTSRMKVANSAKIWQLNIHFSSNQKTMFLEQWLAATKHVTSMFISTSQKIWRSLTLTSEISASTSLATLIWPWPWWIAKW